MASAIDATKPIDGVPAEKTDLRDNLAAAKSEIEALQAGTGLANDAVTNAKLRNSGALSVVGRSANSTGDPADIAASAASGAVLRESGSALGFGTVATAGLADGAVTYAKMQDVSAASRLLGRGSAAGAGDPQELTLGTNLSMSGTTLNAAGGGSIIVQDDGVQEVATATTFNFSGDGVSVTPSGNTATVVIPGAAAGNFTQGGTGAVARSVESKLREYDVSITDYGADPTGVADSTAAIQLAIDYLASLGGGRNGHSTVLFRGHTRYTPASLDWTALTTAALGGGGVTMLVDGRLLPQGGPVLINARMHLVGIGGHEGAQFQLGPCCQVTAATGQIGIWMRSTGNKTLRNVFVGGSTQPAILCTGVDNSQEATLGALYRLENVGATAGSGPDADCLRIKNVFWLWMDKFNLGCGPASTGWTINILDEDPTAILKSSGLMYIENGTLVWSGIRFRGTDANAPAGNIAFRNIIYETGHTAMFTLDTAASVDGISIDRCGTADTSSEYPFFETVNKEASAVSFRDSQFELSGALTFKGPMPRRLDVLPGAYGTVKPFEAESKYPRRGSLFRDGAAEVRDGFRGSEMSPHMVPVVNLGAKQDATTYTTPTSHFQATAGQTAPDGSSTAYLIEVASGGTGIHNARAYDNGSAPMTAGDYLIAGVWLNSAVLAQEIAVGTETPCRMSVFGATRLDGFTSRSVRVSQSVAYAGWVLFVDWWKWTGTNAGWAIMTFQVNLGWPYYLWKPFLLRVPGATHTERDAARIAARMSLIDEFAKPGVLTQLPHHTFRTGIGATGSRPSASAVGEGAQWFDATLNKPIWSDGTVWRDAAGADMT